LPGSALGGLLAIPPCMQPAEPEPDDVALLHAVARRDEGALGALYDRWAQPVFSMLVRIVRSTAEAEEVLQETFWQIWERAADYRRELGSPFCWIVTLARRRAIDRLRADSRHLQRIEEAQATRADEDLANPAGFENVAAGGRGAAVRDALIKLDADERRAIALAFFEGLTHEEIAAALRIPAGTVTARVRRGLLKLKPYLLRLRLVDNPEVRS